MIKLINSIKKTLKKLVDLYLSSMDVYGESIFRSRGVGA